MNLIILCIYLEAVSYALGCEEDVTVIVEGRAVISIPSNMNTSVTHLEIDDTSITTLNLQQLSVYTELCYVHVRVSPITAIITQTQDTKLSRFKLIGAHFPTLPDLGVTLSGQLAYCSWSSNDISTIPGGAFIHYSNLVSLSLSGNPITSLEYPMMQGLTKLKYLYLDNTLLASPPEVYKWAPKLEKLSFIGVELTELTESLVANLPYLRIIHLRNNQLTTLPEKENFVNLESMTDINIKENPLTCDYRLCWLKVLTGYFVICSQTMLNPLILRHIYFNAETNSGRNQNKNIIGMLHGESFCMVGNCLIK